MNTETTVEEQVTLTSKVGLHARPAAAVVKAANDLPTVVSIGKDGRAVDARSMLSLLSLGAEHGDTVTVSAEGPDAADAVATMVALLASNLDEES
ncbi:MAG: HPr family phosphocarrier protein [Nitriliruptor sp.]|nr:MAG: HPr family phosphocarrier protein [Nitriliruptor sp.]